MWTIAARRLIDAYRGQAARGLHLPKATEGVADDAAVAPSAEEQVLDGLLAGPLEAAMRKLSPQLREVLEATVLDGLSTRETAVRVGIPEGTVKARAFRARSALRQALA